MANSKLIVIEGPQGAGKTTVTDYIRNKMSYTNLYRLSGTADQTKDGKAKAAQMYIDLLNYIKKLENQSINLVFDRTFFSEEVYCRLGKKEYNFTDIYSQLEKEFFNLDYEIYYITLYLDDVQEYINRLNRPGKAIFKTSLFSLENSITQQDKYLELAKEIEQEYNQKNIHIINLNTNRLKEDIFNDLNNILSIE